MIRFAFLLVTAVLFVGCKSDAPDPGASNTDGDSTKPITVKPPTEYTYRVVRQLPHDTSAFTQGLIVHDGRFLESTGRHGYSSLREVEIESGRVIRRQLVDSGYFAEGLALHDGKLYQLTWRNFMAFIYEASSFKHVDTLRYYGEGWGLTSDGSHLIMSDGSAQLRFVKPENFAVDHTIDVRWPDGQPLGALNELEWVEGELWANIYMTDRIARIDPVTGIVKGIVDLTGVLPPGSRTGQEDVLNGIAYDTATKKIYVTGKLWPAVYEIEVVPKPAS